MKLKKGKRLLVLLLSFLLLTNSIPLEAFAGGLQEVQQEVFLQETETEQQEEPVTIPTETSEETGEKETSETFHSGTLEEETLKGEKSKEAMEGSKEEGSQESEIPEAGENKGFGEESEKDPEEESGKEPAEETKKESAEGTEEKEIENQDSKENNSEKEILETPETEEDKEEENLKDFKLSEPNQEILNTEPEAGAAGEGSFVLGVFSDSETVVAPTKVAYETGDTVKTALENSDYSFTGLEEGFIQEVQGVTGNYYVVFENGDFNLNLGADQAGIVLISERNDVNKDTNPELLADVSEALKEMADFNHSTNNVKNFPKAAEAYQALLTDIRFGTKESIAAKTEALTEAVDEYETFLSGGKRTVQVKVTQGGVEVKDVHLKFTDQYGNVTEATGNQIQLMDGTYSFVVTDSKAPYNFTKNTGKLNSGSGGSWQVIEEYFTVSETSTSLEVKLANGEWFGEITAEANNDTALDPERTKHDDKAHKYTFYVADTFSGNVKPTFQTGEGTPSKDNAETLSSVDISAWVDYIYASGTDKGKWVSEVKTSSASTNKVSFASARSCLNFLETGMEGNTIQADIRWLDDTGEDATGHIVMQAYELEVKRFPTLKEFSLKDGEGTELVSTFHPHTYAYELPVITDTYLVEYLPFSEEYQVTLENVENTVIEGKEVRLTKDSGSFKIAVSIGEEKTEYIVTLTKVPAVDVTLSLAEGVTAEVFNKSNSLIAPKEKDGKVYALIPGETYTYIGTKEQDYHTKDSFIAAENQTVEVLTPEVKTVITNFAVYDQSSTKTRQTYEWNPEFSEDTYQYLWKIPDVKSGNVLYVQATSTDSDYTYWISHKKQTTTATAADQLQDWIEKTISNVVDLAKIGTGLGSQILAKAGQSNELKLQIRKSSNTTAIYYQEFTFDLVRILTLAELSLSAEGIGELAFTNEEGNPQEFDRDIFDYTVKVGASAEKLSLAGAFQNTEDRYSFEGGYYAVINGTRQEDISAVEIDLDTEKSSETIDIEVGHRDTKAIHQTYTITVEKQEPLQVTFDVSPKNALVYIVNQLDDRTVYSDDNGIFTLMPEVPYTYTVSAPGYKTKQEKDYTLEEAGENETTEVTVKVDLEQAPSPSMPLPDLSAQWPTFRADKNGNGVVSSKTPITPEDNVLYWASKIGEGFDSGATGCPILVDGYLFTYAGNSIVKVDTMTGEVVASSKMVTSSSFAINSPTYAEGMIFVGLSGGRVQAFHAGTLESLWVYQDPKGGQPNCPIKYHDGYIYTGFWNSENKPANFVCIPVTDEDPSNPTEEKLAAWRYTHNGFYWAGAYTSNEFVLVGTDDGEAGYTTGRASVLSFDPATGKLIDEEVLPEVGDLRSDIMYDEHGTKDYYFTTKGGHFYRLKVNPDGTFEKLMYLTLDNYGNSSANPPMSTSTPAIYNGRAYIGVSGEGQFAAYSGHNITVIDLNSWNIAYKVRTQGYPQTSGLLTTAYEKDTELVYVYFIDNYTPGKIRILADKPGQKTALLTTKEGEYDTAKVLFTPVNAQAQYAICSPIADSNGVIYFKNDSGHMMAMGSMITGLEITKLPNQTEYKAGDTFNPEGMSVVANYSNGTSRDVSNYITYSKEPLTVEDKEFTISFPYVMYQDKNGQPGSDVADPMTVLTLKITGDASGDGQEPDEGEDSDSGEEPEIKEELWMEGVQDYEYTGSPVVQENLTVYHGDAELILNQDYTVKYKNNTKAGTASLTVTGKGNYAGSMTKEFQILPLDLSKAKVTDVTLAYNKNVQKATTTVTYTINGKEVKLKAGTDFTYEYPMTNKNGEDYDPDAFKAASDTPYTVILTGKGNYKNSTSFKQYITEATLVSKLSLTKIADQKYDEGKEIIPSVILKHGKEELKQGVHFTVDYQNNEEVGTAAVIIEGIPEEGYAGSRTLTFKITGTPLSKVKINEFNASLPWKEGGVTQEAKLTYTTGSGANKITDTLIEGEDYETVYQKNTEVGTATVIYTGIGGYTGTVKKTFKITGIPMNKVKIEGIETSVEYPGEPVLLSGYRLTWQEAEENPILLEEAGEDGIGDYQVTYKNNQKAGTATITFTGKRGYTGTVNKTFKIQAHDVTAGKVKVESVAEQKYLKGGVFPKPVITYVKDGKEILLTEGTDYTLSYANNKAVWDKENLKKQPKITITGKGGFKGKLTETFSIKNGNLSEEVTMTVSDIVYQKKANLCKPVIAVYDRDGKKLAAGTDYDKNISYTYVSDVIPENNSVERNAGDPVEKTDVIPVGTKILATVKGVNNYEGENSSISAEFTYIKANMQKASVTIAPQTFTGKEILLEKEDLVIKFGKEELSEEDYEITGYSNNLKSGTAKVTIRGIGIYGGEKTVSFKIEKQKMK